MKNALPTEMPFFLLALFAVVLSLPSVASAQSGSAKLVVGWTEGGVAVIEFASAERCERAKERIEAERIRRYEESQRSAEERGARLVSAGPSFHAICIHS